MLEAEITASGDVIVEGQHVGRLLGFRFTPDAEAEGAEARTVRAAAQKTLATTIEQRAGQLAKADDSAIALSSDGNLRWQGEPVARLMAGEDTLKPTLALLADEHLTGPALDAVQTRLTQWLQSRVDTVLAPLTGLAADESQSGLARGLAFRLLENLGILDRRDVLEDVRALDQDARAGLRRHGVRFGAYHIYIPALLKPAASALLAQLWALKHAELDLPGLAELPAISASGRTSIDVDSNFSANVYRRFGYRVYGRRAVRIDILERLADLIRPALSWISTKPGERPDGAVDNGRGFVVTPAMMSLLGASGDDMAVILRGLGYHCDSRPAAEVLARPESEPEPDSATGPEASAPPAPDQADATGATPQTAEPVTAQAPRQDTDAVDASPAISPIELPAAEEAVAAADASAVAPAIAESETEGAPPVSAGDAPPPDVAASLTPSVEAGSSAAPDPSPADAGPEMVEVWRIGGQRRHREQPGRRPQRSEGRPAGSKSPRPRGKTKPGARSAAGKAGAKHKGAKPAKHQPAAKPPRERPIDPDNPFAALAALKKNLEKTGDR